MGGIDAEDDGMSKWQPGRELSLGNRAAAIAGFVPPQLKQTGLGKIRVRKQHPRIGKCARNDLLGSLALDAGQQLRPGVLPVVLPGGGGGGGTALQLNPRDIQPARVLGEDQRSAVQEGVQGQPERGLLRRGADIVGRELRELPHGIGKELGVVARGDQHGNPRMGPLGVAELSGLPLAADLSFLLRRDICTWE